MQFNNCISIFIVFILLTGCIREQRVNFASDQMELKIYYCLLEKNSASDDIETKLLISHPYQIDKEYIIDLPELDTIILHDIGNIVFDTNFYNNHFRVIKKDSNFLNISSYNYNIITTSHNIYMRTVGSKSDPIRYRFSKPVIDSERKLAIVIIREYFPKMTNGRHKLFVVNIDTWEIITEIFLKVG